VAGFSFVLSSFVLAHAYGAKLEGPLLPWHFMIVRLMRLYPLYLMGSALGIAGIYLFHAPSSLAGCWTGFFVHVVVGTSCG